MLDRKVPLEGSATATKKKKTKKEVPILKTYREGHTGSAQGVIECAIVFVVVSLFCYRSVQLTLLLAARFVVD